MKKIAILFIYLFYFSFVNSQIVYNWQNSKEGWVSGGNCNLTAQPEAMAMRLFAPNATMRSGVLSDNLGINGSDYNLVEVTLKNPTAGSGIARLFIYPPNTNSDTCFYTFQVDTSMTGYSTYSISLDSVPSGGLSSPYTGPIARFGLRAPWGGVNFDTIFWKKMVVLNTNQVIDSVDITFKVDMNQVTDPFSNPELNATFNSWCGNCNAMSDFDGDNIWDVTVSLQTGDTIEFKYSADSWSIQETNDPNGFCTNGDPNFTNRVLVVPVNDTILPDVCWGSCNPCSSGMELLDKKELEIFPNPSSNFINFKSNSLIKDFFIIDILGNIIFYQKLENNNLLIDVSKFSNGTYYVNANFDDISIKKMFIVNQ